VRLRQRLAAVPPALVALLLLAAPSAPSLRLGIEVRPRHKTTAVAPALPHADLALYGDGIAIAGWRFPAQGRALGITVVFLHGIGDNRASSLELAERLVPRGFDVVAFDGRAHGESTGDTCTYGFREKRDLSLVLDQLGASRVLLVGCSLGAEIALQAAAEDPRVVGVLASASFADLRSVSHERAPRGATSAQVERALRAAELEGGFDVSRVSPVLAAERIQVPVLLVHGERDPFTRVAHAERILDALAGPKRLVVVAGAGHDVPLVTVWPEVERWLAEVIRGPAAPGISGGAEPFGSGG
jgi:pimeloyl-ACP methyl ester carboxylesterase